MMSPLILALTGVSLITTILITVAAVTGWGIMRGYDPQSTATVQLRRERRRLLISALMPPVMLLRAVSVFFLVYAADRLSGRITGAMCAAGVFHAGPIKFQAGFQAGYPALGAGILTLLGAGVWTVCHWSGEKAAADEGREVRPEEVLLSGALLCFITPLAWAETIWMMQFFDGLSMDIITTCCGIIFQDGRGGAGAANGGGWKAVLFSLTPAQGIGTYIAGCLLPPVVAIIARMRSCGEKMLPAAGIGMLILLIIGVMTGAGPYWYESPHHHCPFCLLQAPYRYIGYPIYVGAGVSAIFSISWGLLSLTGALTQQQKRQNFLWIIAGSAVALICGIWPVLFTDLDF